MPQTIAAPRPRSEGYDDAFRAFRSSALAACRREVYGEDLGQHGWLTADEHRAFRGRLALHANARVLEVGSGSGGPSLALVRATGACLVGVDANAHGIAQANDAACAQGLDLRAMFVHADASRPLAFADASFDAIVCIDAVNHLGDRLAVLREWRRVLRPGGRLLYTDPGVVTGAVTDAERALRTLPGSFVLAPAGTNERLLREAGFTVAGVEDRTASVAAIACGWLVARAVRRDALVAAEGEEAFERMQRFYAATHALAAERRLSRLAFHATV